MKFRPSLNYDASTATQLFLIAFVTTKYFQLWHMTIKKSVNRRKFNLIEALSMDAAEKFTNFSYLFTHVMSTC